MKGIVVSLGLMVALAVLGLAPPASAAAPPFGFSCDPADAGSLPVVNVIVGTGAADILVGTPDADAIYGLNGDDEIFGMGGDDWICGGFGNDFVDGGPGSDRIQGNAGSDELRGSNDRDFLDGGRDGDLIRGGNGDDEIRGDLGDDDLRGERGNDSVFGGNGSDQVRGGDGDDLLRGDAGMDFMFGQAGEDRMFGGGGDDRMFGGADRDIMFGGSGNDRMFGGDGDDDLFGERHDDVLIGEGGFDFADGGPDRNFCDAEIEVNCNEPPVALDDDVATDEDTVLNGDVLADNGSGADFDPDGDPLTVTQVNGSAGNVGVQIGLPSGALLTVNADGTFSYDPNGAFDFLAVGESDTDTFTYEIGDGNGAFDDATVTVTIDGVNDAPDAVDDPSGATAGCCVTDEDTVLNQNGVLDNDTDPDTSDTLVVSEVEGNAGDVGVQIALPSGALLTMQADGTFVYDPNGQFESLAVGESDTDTFTYQASDSNGGTDTATVTVTIDGVNDDPDAVDDSGAGFGTDEDTAFITGDVLGNDTDPDTSDVLSVTGADAVSTEGAAITDNGDGTFVYDPTVSASLQALDDGDAGTDSFGYTIGDGNGGSDSATVTIDVTGVNDAPVANDDGPGGSYVTDENTVLNLPAIGVLGNDTDVDDDDVPGTNVLVTEVEGSAANLGNPTLTSLGGTVTVAGDGSFSYDPTTSATLNALDTGESATDSFSYTIGDPFGDSDTATVQITVNGVNDPPTAGDDAYDSLGNVGISVPAGDGLLGNDDDPEGSISIFSFDATSANGGDVSVAGDGSFTYTPPPGLGGTDTFTYTIQDSQALQDTATVTITLTDLIWFIDNSVSGGGDAGTLADPFETLGAFEAVNGNGGGTDPAAGDTVFVYDGSGAYTGGVTLEDMQVLIGEGASQDIPTISGITLPPFSNPLPATGGTRPLFTNTGGDGITLASDNTIRGLDVGTVASGSHRFTGTSVGSLDIGEVALTPGSGGGVDITTGTLDITFDSIATSGHTGTGIDLDSVGGSFTVSNPGAGLDTDISANAGIQITNSAAGATFSFGETDIDATSGAGIDLSTNSAATFTFDSLDVTSSNGTGLRASNSGTVNIGGTANTIGATNGAGIDVDNTSLGGGWTFDGVTSSGSSTNGIDLNTVTGNFEVTGATDVDSSTNAGIDIASSGGTFTFGTVDIDNTTGGAGLVANNSGTLTIGGTASSITTDGQTALDVTNTNIGAAGITFQSISSDGATSGIVLNNTGTSGGLTITGDGATAGSGGTIQNGTTGISLNQTDDVSLSFVQLNDFTGFAIRGTDVDDFTLADSVISGTNGDSAAADEGSVSFDELTGMVIFEGSNISGGHEDNIVITNTLAGTLDLFVRDSTSNGMVIGLNSTAAGNDGILVETQGTAVANVDVTGVTFLGSRGDHIQVNALGTSVVDVTIVDNTFQNAHTNSLGGGVTLSGGSASSNITMTYDISGTTPGSQTFTGAESSAITVNIVNGQGTATGTIQNNNIGTSGGGTSNGTGSATGSGIAVGATTTSNPQNLTHTVLIDNNTVFGIDGFAGLDVFSGRSADINATITNNSFAEFGGFALAAFNSIVGGVDATDDGVVCLDMRDNVIDGSTLNAGAPAFAFATIFMDQIFTPAHYRLPGYAGADGDSAAILSYFQGLGNTISAGMPPPGVEAGTTSGITNTGTACP